MGARATVNVTITRREALLRTHRKGLAPSHWVGHLLQARHWGFLRLQRIIPSQMCRWHARSTHVGAGAKVNMTNTGRETLLRTHRMELMPSHRAEWLLQARCFGFLRLQRVIPSQRRRRQARRMHAAALGETNCLRSRDRSGSREGAGHGEHVVSCFCAAVPMHQQKHRSRSRMAPTIVGSPAADTRPSMPMEGSGALCARALHRTLASTQDTNHRRPHANHTSRSGCMGRYVPATSLLPSSGTAVVMTASAIVRQALDTVFVNLVCSRHVVTVPVIKKRYISAPFVSCDDSNSGPSPRILTLGSSSSINLGSKNTTDALSWCHTSWAGSF